MKVSQLALFRYCLFAVLFLTAPSSVAANVGPPASGGHVIAEPAGISGIVIVHEDLMIDLCPLARNDRARVEATYHLRNQGPTQTLDLLFASGSQSVNDFRVWLDDIEIPANPAKEQPLPDSWKPPKQTPSLDGRNFSYLAYMPEKVVPMGFTATIPNGEHRLRVEYRASAAKHHNDAVLKYHQFAYILAPARAWEALGRLDVTIHLPTGWLVACSPELRREGDTLQGSFPSIPANAIALTLRGPIPDSYFWLSWGTNVLLIVTCIAMLGFCWYVGRNRGREIARFTRTDIHHPNSRTWPTALMTGFISACVTFGAGLLAIYLPQTVLPTDQASHYGYGQVFALLGVLLLSGNVAWVGFSITLISSRVVWRWLRGR